MAYHITIIQLRQAISDKADSQVRYCLGETISHPINGLSGPVLALSPPHPTPPHPTPPHLTSPPPPPCPHCYTSHYDNNFL